MSRIETEAQVNLEALPFPARSTWDGKTCVVSAEVDDEVLRTAVDAALLITSDPLDPAGVAATLNAVLGIWPLADAANAVGLTPADLIAEAQAWAAAQQVNP